MWAEQGSSKTENWLIIPAEQRLQAKVPCCICVEIFVSVTRISHTCGKGGLVSILIFISMSDHAPDPSLDKSELRLPGWV